MGRYIKCFFSAMVMLLVIVLSGCSNSITTEEGFKAVSFLSNKVELLIPDDFDVMSEDMMKTKYPSENRPQIVYTNESGSINVAFHYTESTASSSELPTFLETIKTLFENMGSSSD